MKKADLYVGMSVSFQTNHGEVLGAVVEMDRDSILVMSDIDRSHRWRIPMKFVVESKSFKERGVK